MSHLIYWHILSCCKITQNTYVTNDRRNTYTVAPVDNVQVMPSLVHQLQRSKVLASTVGHRGDIETRLTQAILTVCKLHGMNSPVYSVWTH